jgi:phage terminase small subunit
MSNRRLTSMQEKFVREFAKGKSATQACKDAGYSETYANREASQLLGKPQIREAIDKLNQKLASPAIADVKERREFWTTTLRNCDVPWKDRLRASELLGKSEGDFIDRHEHTGPGGGAITQIVRIVRPAEAKPLNANGFIERQSLNGKSH